MSERATISQGIQIGVEAVPGTPVAANKRLQSIGFEPGPQANIDTYRPGGQKFPALTTLGREWMEFGLTGRPSYDEIIYILASVIGNPVVTPVGAGTARQWSFTPSTFAEDTPKTFTIEQGGSVRAHRFSYGLVNEVTLGITRDAVDLGGGGIARRIEDDVAMTPAPTALPLVPILGGQMDVFIDDVVANLGDTKFGRLLNATFTLGSRYNPLWIVDSEQDSFVAHVEVEPTLSLEVTVEANEQGMGLLEDMRGSERNFLRVLATGPAIAGGAENYEMQIDLAGEIGAMGSFSDEDGVYAVGWTFTGVHDAGWGKAVQAQVINSVAAL